MITTTTQGVSPTQARACVCKFIAQKHSDADVAMARTVDTAGDAMFDEIEINKNIHANLKILIGIRL